MDYIKQTKHVQGGVWLLYLWTIVTLPYQVVVAMPLPFQIGWQTIHEHSSYRYKAVSLHHWQAQLSKNLLAKSQANKALISNKVFLSLMINFTAPLTIYIF